MSPPLVYSPLNWILELKCEIFWPYTRLKIDPWTILSKKNLFGTICFGPTLIKEHGFTIMPFTIFWPIYLLYSTVALEQKLWLYDLTGTSEVIQVFIRSFLTKYHAKNIKVHLRDRIRKLKKRKESLRKALIYRGKIWGWKHWAFRTFQKLYRC